LVTIFRSEQSGNPNQFYSPNDFFVAPLPGAKWLRKLSHTHRVIDCRPIRGLKHQRCVID